MIILGIHYNGHESGITLIENGEVIFSASEERYNRVKGSNGAPAKAIKKMIHSGILDGKKVDIIAMSRKSVLEQIKSNKNIIASILMLSGYKALGFNGYFNKGRYIFDTGMKAYFANLASLTGIPAYLFYEFSALILLKIIFLKYKYFRKARITFEDHHECHVHSAYWISGFKGDCLSIVCEGYDGYNSVVIDKVSSGKIERLFNTPFPHSPGHFYSLATFILGFNPYTHGGKVTGLAAYGNPDILYDRVNKLMYVENGQLKLGKEVYLLRHEYAKTKSIPKYFKSESIENIAAAFQKVLEDCVVKIVAKKVKETGITDLLLSGGVMANVRLNQKIKEIQGVRNIFIAPPMGDVGQPLGASFSVAFKYGDIKEPYQIENMFLGNRPDVERIEREIKQYGFKFKEYEDIDKRISELLVDKKVVAHVSGRMEYGPRALGNRSILYHCGDVSVNKWLNIKLNRTEFMPFAPVCLYEFREVYFKNIKGCEYAAEFMTITFDVTEEFKKTCPAVVHVDGTARPQLVKKDNNPKLYNILKYYYELTHIPVLINTSFNIHNEPIVSDERDALMAFDFSRLDYLVIENYLIWK